MGKKLKPIRQTSRGGRRQVLIKQKQIRDVCESVSKQTGYPFQWCFDELMEMFAEGFLFGVNTKDALIGRIFYKLEDVESYKKR